MPFHIFTPCFSEINFIFLFTHKFANSIIRLKFSNQHFVQNKTGFTASVNYTINVFKTQLVFLFWHTFNEINRTFKESAIPDSLKY